MAAGRRHRPPRDAAATMSLIAHLRELRNRVALVLLVLGLATAFCFWWYDHGLGAFIRAPYCAVPSEQRALGGSGSDCALLITDVFGGALIRLKIALLAGIVLSAPFWLFQIWRFITPGLKSNEKRYGLTFVGASTALFALGAVLAYFSLKAGLTLLIQLAGNNVAVALTAQDYLGFVVSVLLAFGVSFEVPLLAVALNLVGVLSHPVLKKSPPRGLFLALLFAPVHPPP